MPQEYVIKGHILRAAGFDIVPQSFQDVNWQGKLPFSARFGHSDNQPAGMPVNILQP